MYRVNHIFYSLQGEGRNTGRAAVFIRFAGCNLRCGFCDTEFDEYREMSSEEILDAVKALVPSNQTPLPWRGAEGRFLIVLTGGEPTLQVDEAFVELLHGHGYEVAMESNGTRPAPRNLDWLCVSPKMGQGAWGKEQENRRMPDEIKLVFDEHTDPEALLLRLATRHMPLLYLQPCDTGDERRNKAIIQQCVDYIKAHPQWRLSLQTHKLIGIE
jgi:organic radical activating enzyme